MKLKRTSRGILSLGEQVLSVEETQWPSPPKWERPDTQAAPHRG